MGDAPTKIAKPRRKRAQESEEIERFGILLEEAQKFCETVGLHKDLILEIAKADSDWAFIPKIDALLETASKEIIRHGLRLKILNRVIRNDILGDFVDSLPINGKTSILKLLDAAGCPYEDLGFIEATRRVRNAYAHNIKFVDVSLIALIKQRPDKTELLKKLSAIKNFDEADLIEMYEKDHGFLRFCISRRNDACFVFRLPCRRKVYPKESMRRPSLMWLRAFAHRGARTEETLAEIGWSYNVRG